MGEVERQSGPSHWEAAWREFRRALALDPGSADAQHRLGWLALRSGRTDEALSHLQAAVRLEPRRAEAWYLLGQAALRAGRPDEARRALEQFRQCRASSEASGS
jgi:Flp pilus assembly protein TadD